jgi:uncharacterized metal-binding protein YceD (DUF177 family)
VRPTSQDDTLAAQAALEKQLSAVGEDVEDINNRVGEVGSCLVVPLAITAELAGSSDTHILELHLSKTLDMLCARCLRYYF